MSFTRFLGIGMGENVPDAKTIWLFKNKLAEEKTTEKLFALFNQMLTEKNIITHKGSIVDASIIEVRRQHNTPEEKSEITEKKIPEQWKERKNKLRQKDLDARCTRKRNRYYYGYKDHVKVDTENKIITKYSVTPANVHDSQALVSLVDEQDEVLFADSAYQGKKIHAQLPTTVRLEINEKAQRNHPLTEEQKRKNIEKSRTRVLVEHVFAQMKERFQGRLIRCVGILRAAMQIGLRNLVYNFFRYEFLLRTELQG